mgnify:CR=1 FL=1
MVVGSIDVPVGSNVGYVSSVQLQQRYDGAYMQCMYAKGNQIPVRMSGPPPGYQNYSGPPPGQPLPQQAQPRLSGLDPADRLAPRNGDDEILDIPAFLRQAGGDLTFQIEMLLPADLELPFDDLRRAGADSASGAVVLCRAAAATAMATRPSTPAAISAIDGPCSSISCVR